jgi:hypothetical protein
MKRSIWFAVAAMVWVAPAWAITVDGTKDVDYGDAVSVQKLQTQFGDAQPPGSFGGSELDAAYVKIEGGRLYLMLTGNHEPNFNKLEVFFDTVAGGEQRLTPTPEYDFFNGGAGSGFQWISRNLGGLRFDDGFTADYHLFARWGGGGDPAGYEVDFVNRQGGTQQQVPGSSGVSPTSTDSVAIGSIPAANVGTNASGAALTQSLDFAINNTNSAGVSGGQQAADMNAALDVTTGMEFSIALADLGNPAPGSQIKIFAAIDNGDHNYLSNQMLGSLQPDVNTGNQNNLGGDGAAGFSGTLGAAGGDYNRDTNVDAADYTIWRDNFGSTTFQLPYDPTPESVDTDDYDLWKTNYGQEFGVNLNNFPGQQYFVVTIPGPLVGAASGVPEPTSLAIGMLGLLGSGALLGRRR